MQRECTPSQTQMVKKIQLILFLLIVFSATTAQTVENLFNSGLEKHKRSDFVGAIADFTAAIRQDPSLAVIYFCRGQSYAELKQAQQAIADYSKAIELSPLNANAYLNRAEVYASVNQNSLSIKDLTKLLSIAPSNAKAYLLRGQVYSKTYDYRRAITDFNKVLEIDSTNRNALFFRSQAKLEQSDFGGAISDMEMLLEKEPSNAELHYLLGIANIRGGKVNKGCSHLKTARNLGESRANKLTRDRCAFHEEKE